MIHLIIQKYSLIFLSMDEDADTLLSGIRIVEKLLETNTMRASIDDVRQEIYAEITNFDRTLFGAALLEG